MPRLILTRSHTPNARRYCCFVM